MQEMKREMKSLQDKNMMFMQQNLDLEDVKRERDLINNDIHCSFIQELRRLSSTKELLDTQKQRVSYPVFKKLGITCSLFRSML